MQFKHKLIYFALGCAFVVIGQVLLSVVVPKVTAQGKKEAVEFDTVKVRSLQVVDDAGKVRAQLEVIKRESEKTIDNVIQVFNGDGVPVYQVTDSSILVNDGNKKTSILMDSYGLIIVRGIGQIRVQSDIGAIGVDGNDGKTRAIMMSGTMAVNDNDGHIRATIRTDAYGGVANFCDNDGKLRAAIGVNEYGHGIVATYDKDGVPSDISSSTTQRKEVYPGVSGGHWVSKVMESGKYVMLEDKSLWEVSPLDRTNSMLWLVTEKITILENKDGIYILSYPYKLINSDSKDTVEAKYLGK